MIYWYDYIWFFGLMSIPAIGILLLEIFTDDV
jgi:hypothetical protein